MMALSLAACGGSSTTTTATTTTTTTTTDTTTDTTGSAFTLTTVVDTMTGTANDDTFTANQATFAAGDIISGGDGTDTLQLTVTGAYADPAPALTSGIETLSISATGDSVGLDAAMITDSLATIKSTASSKDVTVSNVQLSTAIVADATTDNDIRVIHKDSLAAGTDDAVSFTATNGAVVDVLGVHESFETVNIASTGASANTVSSVVGLDASNSYADTDLIASTVNITGSADLTVNLDIAAGDKITIDAGDYTGDLSLTVDTDVDSVIGGSGNDEFTFDGAPTAATDSVDGGDGTDTMVIATGISSVTSGNSITNFEAVTVTEADGGAAADDNVAVKASVFGSGLETVKYTGLNDNTNANYLNGLVTDYVSTVTVESAMTKSGSGVLSVELTAVADSGANTANVKVSSAALDMITLNESSSSNDEDWFDTINLTVAADAVSVGKIIALGADTVNVLGTGSFTYTGAATDFIGSAANAAGVEVADRAISINTTQLVGAADITIPEAGDFTVTLGAGVANGSTGITNTVTLGTAGAGKTVVGTTGALDVLELTQANSATDLALTVTNIDRVTIAEETVSNDQAVDLENFTGVGEIVLDGSDSIELKNVSAGQVIASATRGSADILTVTAATGVTAAGITFTGTTANDTNAGLSTNATTFTITDGAADSDGLAIDNNIDLETTHAVTTLNLVGGGLTASDVNSVFTLEDHSDTGILETLNFANYAGDVVMSTLELGNTTSATNVLLASAADANLTVIPAQLYRDTLSITGGTGDNTVIATGVGVSGKTDLRPEMTSVETLDLTLVNGQSTEAETTVELRDATSVQTLKLGIADYSTTSAQAFEADVNIDNLASGATLSLTGGTNGGTTYGQANTTSSFGIIVEAAVTKATTITVDNAGAADAVTVAGYESSGTTDGGLVLGSTYTTLNVDQLEDTGLTFTLIEGSGLTSIDIDNNDDASAGDLTITDIVAASTESLSIDSSTGNVIVTALNTMNSLETLAVNTGAAAGGHKTTITAGTSTSIDTITASGTGAFEITALTAASLDSVNASGVTGAVTLGSASAALTTAAGATITTGTGADVITMSTASSLTLTAGEHDTNDDNLILVGTMNSGAGVINLSSSDQVVTINGTADAAVQSQFEDVDVSAVTTTGSYGFGITAAAEGSVIVGSGANDTITGGAGADTITGGAGDDTINLTVDGVVDTLVITTSMGTDTVTNFGTTDKMDISGLLTATTIGTKIDGNSSTTGVQAIAITETTPVDVTDGAVVFLKGTATSLDTASEIEAMHAASSAVLDKGDSGDDYIIFAGANNDATIYVYEANVDSTDATTGIAITALGVLEMTGYGDIDDLAANLVIA